MPDFQLDLFDILKYISLFYTALFAGPFLISKVSSFSLSFLEGLSYSELHEYLVAKDYLTSTSTEIRFWGKAYEYSGYLILKIFATVPVAVAAYAGFVMLWVIFQI